MAISFDYLIQQLEAKKYASVYFLQGNEPYYISQLVTYMETEVLDEAEKQLNLRIYYGNEASLRDVLSYARCVPLLGDRQVIMVKEAQHMAILSRAEGQKKLLDYLTDPNPRTILVFAYQGKGIKAKAFTEAFKRHAGVLFTTPTLYDNQLIPWITTYVQKKGYTITPEAAFHLQHCIGAQLQRLANTLDKIMLQTLPGTRLTLAVIGQHVVLERSFSVFELQDALSQRDIDKAFQIVNQCCNYLKKNPPLAIVSALATFFMKVVHLQRLRHKSSKEQAALVQVHPFFLKNYALAAEKHSFQALVHYLRVLYEADLQLKGIDCPALSEGDVLKEMVAKLCRMG